MAKITKRTVDALEPRDREHVLWDDEIKGFGVRVRPSGRKTYIVKYRDRGRAVKVTIGPHGAISPAAARARAAEIVTAARTGRDLSGRDLRDAKAPSVAELGRRFLDEYVTDHCKPNTKRQYRKMVEGYILPRLGTRRVPDVQRVDVASLHHDRGGVAVVGILISTGDREHAEAQHRGQRVDYQCRVAPVPDAARQRLGQAEPAFDLAQKDHAAVRRDQPAIETGSHLLASDGWKIEREKGIFNHGGVALSLPGKKDASTTNFHPITTTHATFATTSSVHAE